MIDRDGSTERCVIKPMIVVRDDPGDGAHPCDKPGDTPRRPEQTGPFHVGQVVGGAFEITAVLGSGGMGVVYEAIDRRLLRRVAIKTARHPAHAAALRTEAQGLVAIHSPYFVTVHAFLEWEGVEFLVMERLFGETLDTQLEELEVKGEHMPTPMVLDLLIALAEALSAAHRAGIAQRDLKPSNVMLCGSRVVLVDLGLFIPEIMVDASNTTAGSVEYVAPEVIRGAVRRGEGWLVDLYALGVLAYELLTNTTPFVDRSMARTLQNHLTMPVPEVRDLRPDVPRDLALLIKELLAKDPSLRPPSAESALWQLMAIRSDGERMPAMRIVAVDDDANVGRALKRSLESVFPKLHVETTTDPTHVLPQEGTVPPDVFLVDLNMPHQNGIEVCMSLLALPRDQRPLVVAMSAAAEQRDIDVLRALGVDHFVTKDEAFVTSMSQVIGDLRDTWSRGDRGGVHTAASRPSDHPVRDDGPLPALLARPRRRS